MSKEDYDNYRKMNKLQFKFEKISKYLNMKVSRFEDNKSKDYLKELMDAVQGHLLGEENLGEGTALYEVWSRIKKETE